MINALNIVNNVLFRAFDENIDVTPMKIQKLVYFIYRDYLKNTGKKLFLEEFEAWKYGPVVPNIYYAFKHLGANSIRSYIKEPDGKTVLIADEGNAPELKSVIDTVWSNCKSYSGIYLSSLTHMEGGAWRKAWLDGKRRLLDEEIKEDEISYVRH